MLLGDRTTMGHDPTKVVQLVGFLVPIFRIQIEMLVAVLGCVIHGAMDSWVTVQWN